MSYQVLLADADGTLFDFTAGERLALEETFRRFSIPLEETFFHAYHLANEAQWRLLERGETTPERLQTARMENFLKAAGFSRSPEEMNVFFRDRLGERSVLYPGALEFCARVASRMPIYLVTNGLAQVQHARFDRCPLSPYISGLLISEEVGAAKPDPAILHAALRMAGVAPEHAALLGDSPSADIPAANRAGVFSILYTGGRPAPADHGANAVASSYSEAERLLLGSAGEPSVC